MKRTSQMKITVVAYILAIATMFFGVNEYIDKKDDRLREDIHNKIRNIFNGRRFIDIAYSGYKVEYENISIPPKPKELEKLLGNSYSKGIDEWKDRYGDLNRLYRIGGRSGLNDYKDGWNLIVLEYDYDGVYKTWLFPYAVGYKKQEYSWFYNYMPSVKDAVYDALDFFISNEKSNYIDDYEKGSYQKIWSQILDYNNEYYWLQRDTVNRFYYTGRPLFEDYSNRNERKSPYQATYVHDGYTRVFIAQTQPQTYTIKKYAWNPDETEKVRLWMYWSIALTIIMLSVVIPLAVINHRHIKIKNETLYDRLLRLCNPAMYINQYDRDKLDKANSIYQRLLLIDKNDSESIYSIQIQAINELGLELVDKERLADLKEKVNPIHFMNPYNAEKVALANDLYARLAKRDLTFEEFTEVEKLSKQL